MKILVTGGAGFIASHIVDSYINAGHEVVIIDNLSTGKVENVNSRAQFFCADIRDSEIEEIFETNNFDVVNHHAAQMDVRKSVEDPIFDAEVNVLGTLTLLQNCVKYKVGKFIFASTGGAIYGEQNYFPADEDHPTQPYSPYGITKLSGEKYLFFYKLTYGLKYVVLRYANVYGPRQNPHGEAGVVAIFCSKLLSEEPAIINGDGKQTRDYVFVGDVVRANLMALDHSNSDIFNIGTGKETTVNEIFAEINNTVAANVKERHGPAKEGEQFRSVIDHRKASKILRWKPEVDLREGIKRTVDFFRSQRQQNP